MKTYTEVLREISDALQDGRITEDAFDDAFTRGIREVESLREQLAAARSVASNAKNHVLMYKHEVWRLRKALLLYRGRFGELPEARIEGSGIRSLIERARFVKR